MPAIIHTMPAILLFVSFSLKKPKLRSGTNTLPKDSITGPFLYSTPPYAHRLINIEQTKSPYPLMTHMFKYQIQYHTITTSDGMEEILLKMDLGLMSSMLNIQIYQ